MAIAWSQGKTAEPASSGSTIAVTLDSPVSVGDMIVVAAGHGALVGDYSLDTCADSLGNTYTRQRSVQDSTNTQGLSVFTAPVTSAGTPTITVTLASSKSFRAILAGVWTGVNTSGTPVNVVGPGADAAGAAQTSAAGASDNATTQAVLTTADNCMVVAVVENTSSASAVTAGTAATQRLQTSTVDMVMQEQAKATAGSVTPAATIAGGAGTSYLSTVVALVPPAAGAGGTSRMMLLGVG